MTAMPPEDERMSISPGFHFDMSARDYFADPCPAPSLTQSVAKVLIDRSPAHARLRHPRLNPDLHEPFEYERALAIGNAAHKLLIGRGKEVCVIEADDFRTKEARATRDTTISQGYVPILAKHIKLARELVVVARAELDAIGLHRAFREGHGETVAVWQEHDLWLRSMIDWADVDADVYYDLKTTGRSAAPHAVPGVMADAGWPVQAAFQERGLDVIDPDRAGRRTFVFVMVENEPPYGVSVHEMSEAVLTIGRKQVDHAVSIWGACVRAGAWPGYPRVVNAPEMPGYAEAKWLQREIDEYESGSRERMLTDLAGG
jgi:PDDEXK-like domain of unknown function (DUF3799)